MKSSVSLQKYLRDVPNLSLLHPLDKRLDIDDPDAVEVFEVSQMEVTGYDVIGLGLHRAGKEHIVSRIVLDLIELVTASRDQSLFHDHADKIVDVVLRGLELLKNPGIVDHAVKLGHDLL